MNEDEIRKREIEYFRALLHEYETRPEDVNARVAQGPMLEAHNADGTKMSLQEMMLSLKKIIERNENERKLKYIPLDIPIGIVLQGAAGLGENDHDGLGLAYYGINR